MAILIKRYANRKLYNTQASRYITLKGISELIDSGQEVRVIDNETGEDITSVALSQILAGRERSDSALPRSLLSQLIERGGDVLYGAIKRSVDDASDGIGEIQERVRKIVRNTEAEGEKIGNWISLSSADFDRQLQGTVERVFKALDLPRRSDVDALNANLQKVADAVEALEKAFASQRTASETQTPNGDSVESQLQTDGRRSSP